MGTPAISAVQKHAKAGWLNVLSNPIIVLGVGLVVILGLRLTLTDDYLGYAADMGSYLQTRNWILGLDPNGANSDHFRPPLIGILLLPFTSVFGDLSGSKLLAIIASVLPAIGFYLFARRFVSPWLAVTGALIFIHHPALADKAAGGFLPLLALPLVLWGFTVLLDIKEGKAPVWLLAIPTLLIVGLNQTAAALYAIVLLVLLVFSDGDFRRGLIGLVAAFSLSLVWLPFYIPIWLLRGELRVEGVPFIVFKEDTKWTTLAYALTFPALALLSYSKKAIHFFMPGVVLTFMIAFGSGHSPFNNLLHRADILLPAFMILGGLMAFERFIPYHQNSINQGVLTKGLTVAAVVAIVFILHPVFTSQFQRTAKSLNWLNEDNLKALEWLRANTSSEDSILAHPQGLSWYVGGLIERRWYGTWEGRPLKYWERQHESFLCAMTWKDSWCNPTQLKMDYGVKYVVFDWSSWQGIWGMPEDGRERLKVNPYTELVFRQGEVEIYQVR